MINRINFKDGKEVGLIYKKLKEEPKEEYKKITSLKFDHLISKMKMKIIRIIMF
jgi:hypothetical protein